MPTIYVQRIGDRNNDTALSEAGRYEFLDLFYAFNKPIYWKLGYGDFRNRVLHPEHIRNQTNEAAVIQSL